MGTADGEEAFWIIDLSVAFLPIWPLMLHRLTIMTLSTVFVMNHSVNLDNHDLAE